MNVAETRKNDSDPGDDMWQSVLLNWRIRCEGRRAAVEATAGPKAIGLCAAVVRTLEQRSPAPDLALAARRWTAGVSAPAEARFALLSLCEVVTELSGDVFHNESPPKGLDPVLEQLASEAAAVSTRRIESARIDTLTGCGDRRAFERDLVDLVAIAIATGLDVAVAVAELDTSPKASPNRPGKRLHTADDASVLGLAATLRRALGRADGVYRVGKREFAVLAPNTDVAGMGELILLATCAPGPRFSWGAAGLSAVGTQPAESPDYLLLLAEANLQLRRRDFSHANALLARRRRMSAVASVAAVTVFAGGIALGLDASAGAPGQLHVALPAPASRTPPTRSPGSSAPSGPASSVPTAAPSSAAGAASAVSPGNGSGSVSPPAMTVSLVVNQSPHPLLQPAPPPPAPPPPAPTAPQGRGGPVALKGHSASAPGHLKGPGGPAKHA